MPNNVANKYSSRNLPANSIKIPRIRGLPCRSYLLKPIIGINTYINRFKCWFCDKKIPSNVLYYNGGHGIKVCEKCIKKQSVLDVKIIKREIKRWCSV